MWTKFDYQKAASLNEAFKLLAKNSGQAAVFAGGSDILVSMRGEGSKPKVLVDIKAIPGLDKISYKKRVLSIGANVTLSTLLKARPAVKAFEIFQEAGKVFGSPQIRNRATVGGNICRASPSSDLAPCLLVLDAKVIAASKGKKRKIAMAKFFTGPGETALNKNELAVAVEVPAPPGKTGTSFVKLRRTNFDLALVNVAAAIRLKNRKVDFVRIALGGVAPTPMRALKAEKLLKGKLPSKKLLREAALLAASETEPISDVRASAEYREHVSRVLVERALENASGKIGGASWK